MQRSNRRGGDTCTGASFGRIASTSTPAPPKAWPWLRHWHALGRLWWPRERGSGRTTAVTAQPEVREGVRLVNLVLVFVMSVLIRVLFVYGYSTFGLHLQREARERAAVPAEVAGRGAPGECH